MLNNRENFNQDLFKFLMNSPSPFHATAQLAAIFKQAGFEALRESERWNIRPGKKYFVTRNDSAIVAWVSGTQTPDQSGWRIAGAHTDSPCLRIKPKPEIRTKTYLQLGVETYGAPLLTTWFDRNLSIAGRVTYSLKNGGIASRLIDLQRPIANVASLAIHLNPEANEPKKINRQTELPPLFCLTQTDLSFHELLAQRLAVPDLVKILSYELSLYDTQPPSTYGFHDEFFAAARIDNLLSCHAAAQAVAQHQGGKAGVMFVAYDHEEIGNQSAAGAEGTLLRSVLRRQIDNEEGYQMATQQSLFLSVDAGHALHPNYPDKHDGNHGPLLNGGPTLKINANQRYASNSDSAGQFIQACQKAEVPYQLFVTRSDLNCGSTIGPTSAATLGMPTVDIGVSMLAMHSIRETAGTQDPYLLHQAIAAAMQR